VLGRGCGRYASGLPTRRQPVYGRLLYQVSPTQDHLDTYYSRYYRRARPVHKYRQATKELHGQYLCQFLNERNRVLELGAADGFTAVYLASQGHEVLVYEPSASYEKRLKDIPDIIPISNLSAIPPGELDAIYLHHVFEHVASPLEYAKGLQRLLKPGGILFIQVPDLSLQVIQYQRRLWRNVYSFFNPPTLWRDQISYDFWSVKDSYPWLEALNNDHVSAFTPEGLKYIVEQSGFEVEQLQQSTSDKVTYNPQKYSWPVETSTGNTPNSYSISGPGLWAQCKWSIFPP
jgi:predicted SAM-dependent methyltransferase